MIVISVLATGTVAGVFAWAVWKLSGGLVVALREARIKASLLAGQWFFKPGFTEPAEFARADQPVAFWALVFAQTLAILLFSAMGALFVWALVLALIT